MIDCAQQLQPDGTYRCPQCGWTYHKLARRNCPGANGQAKRTRTKRPCGKRATRTELITDIDFYLWHKPRPLAWKAIVDQLCEKLTCLEMQWGRDKRTVTRATRRPCGKRGNRTESRTVLIDVIDQLLGMTPPVPDEQINRLYARLTCLEMKGGRAR